MNVDLWTERAAIGTLNHLASLTGGGRMSDEDFDW